MSIDDIFYKEIVFEAANGRIENYFTYNIIFNTYLKEENKIIKGNENKDVIVPLLIINNRELFTKLLEEYVNLACEFYKDSDYLKELINENIDIRKNIIAMLWSNATYEDFNDGIEFLKRRINFLNSEICESKKNYGYIDLFKGNLEIEIKKDEIYNESPYQFNIRLNSEGMDYNFPFIKFGISNNTLYIYAIQNKDNKINSYLKKVNRLLYKANNGFDYQKDLPEIYGIDNLKDISVSFLIAINICLSYFKNIGINNVIVGSILLPRWNAKRIAINKRYKETEKYQNLITEQERIQHNLTEKLLRTFLRLKIHYEGINIIAYPFDIDSNLHLNISNMNTSNNEFLEQTSKIIYDNKNKNL